MWAGKRTGIGKKGKERTRKEKGVEEGRREQIEGGREIGMDKEGGGRR